MTAREEGFLLLSSCLGNPQRNPLSTSQLRILALRVAAMEKPAADRDLSAADLITLGYAPQMAARILCLLEDRALLEHYLRKGRQAMCCPITRVSQGYPVQLRRRLGLDSPGVLWAKGNASLLEKPMVALVGSRNIGAANAEFAAQVGAQAAKQGYVLISGNARGADRIAQNACLAAGGQVISVVADELMKQRQCSNVLYISEEDFDAPFTTQRALSRNRVIHALAEKTFVAQCSLGKGGTWSGTARNLKENWSSVFCFRDGSEATLQLTQLGATAVSFPELENFAILAPKNPRFF